MATANECIKESYNYIDGKMAECPKNKGKYITCSALSYGDYDSSCSVERANVQYILDNYASNRYIQIVGGYGFNHIYLKNTKVNAELICSLSEYPSIDDEYLSDWEYQHAKEQFLDTDLKEIPVLYDALVEHYKDTNVNVDDIDNSEYFWNLYDKISSEFGQQAYYFENDNAVFCFTATKWHTEEINQNIQEYLRLIPPFKQMIGTLLIESLDWIVEGIESITKTQNIIGCLCLHSYTDLNWYVGGSDYMESHEFPFQEVEIDKNTSKQSITDILIQTYNLICDDSYEQLDMIPC